MTMTTKGRRKGGRPLGGDEARRMYRRATSKRRVDKLIKNFLESGYTLQWPEQERLTFDQVAKVLNWSRQAVYHATVNTRELPFEKRGGQYYISRKKLLDFVIQMCNEELEAMDRDPLARVEVDGDEGREDEEGEG